MIIAACNCGAAITGADRAEVIEATSAHLRTSDGMRFAAGPGGIGARDHSALIGEADARIALTVTIEAPEAAVAPQPGLGAPEPEDSHA